MKIDWNFFQSKVARRVFLLFILSALIPVIFLAIFQITQISRQLNETSQQHVRQSVKTIGMDLIGRLFHLENQISLLGKAIIALPQDDYVTQSEQLSGLAPDFVSLTLMDKEKTSLVLKGKKLVLPMDMKALSVGQTAIAVRPPQTGGSGSHVMMIHRLDPHRYLLGRVKNIWMFDIHSNALFWVIGPKNQLIYTNTASSVPENVFSLKMKQDSDVFPWQTQQEEYFVGYWSLFLKQRLKSENWTVVLAEPMASVLSQAKSLYSIFIPTVLVAIFLTMFLTQAQIRRVLTPLEKLRKATKRIAKRDFTTPVNVTSHDEFEELGEAFNAMASQLNRQFKTLSILSMLDKSILTNKDGEAILNIIFDRLKEAVNYDVLVLGMIRHEDKTRISLTIDDADRLQIEIAETELSKQDLLLLQQNQDRAIDLKKDGLPDYLASLTHHRMNYFILFPILHRGIPTAIMGMGFKEKETLKEFNTNELRDIFYRASIAFTHAEWEEQLYRQAHYDDLTHLPNRLMLRDAMNDALERAVKEETYCVLMFLDLDNFKDVNDTLGHSIGDRFLALVAKRMHQQLGNQGLLARIGGDEFTILLSDIPSVHIAKKQAEEVAERLLKAFDEPFLLEDMEYFATASIGIAIYPKDCKTSDELLKYADMSMYLAKARGKNDYEFFSSELEVEVIERNELLQELHSALQEKQFLIYYQPKIDSLNNTLIGAEALIRWQHPTRGLLLPDLFLNLAEESNLIFAIGDLVIKNTCQQLKDWQNEGYLIPPIAINIAARQFSQKDLSQRIASVIKKSGVNPTFIEFEVTESAFIENFDETVVILNQLKELGCKLTIDDFGTGYSSMHYLMKLPVDTMKIDRIFIHGIPQNEKNISIIKAIKTLALNLGMQVVAEGIETKEQSDLLKDLGCEYQQGYYFSRPLSPDEFARNYLKKIGKK
ncbi:EAL domain-containing protein [Legionella impletisoli]|uniref:Uncharacterized protein n=1 Tax=Legionella impletisoli TaxID=343510 RepID=A0A917JWB4_9GAMM|nr:EAL domain-containing protein [Legionella impletisoli]GGI88233.1 hypothetical protein GCM10007966_16190 [Legionella impletisoli]